jgi:hypothetical protein
MKTNAHAHHGSACLYVVLIISILTFSTAVVLRSTQEAHTNTFRTASWEEALPAAESGIDLGIAELRKHATAPDQAWKDPWVSSITPTGVVTASCVATLTHGGEGGSKTVSTIKVDSPDSLVDYKGWRYYRVRAIGMTELSGSKNAGTERRDLDLRKYSLRKDRVTGDALTQPHVTRSVEVIVRPKSAFSVAILSQTSIVFTNHNIVVDSYDSTDSTKSTLGQWDMAKRQKNGDVATNGTFISAGDAQIFGSLYTNGGSVSGISNVSGQIHDDFNQDLQSIKQPEWTPSATSTPVGTDTFLVSPSIATGSETILQAGPVPGVMNYKLSKVALGGNGDKITIKGDPTVRTYVNVWVTGDLSVTGNGVIVVDPNVSVTFYTSGNVNLQGNGITNGSTDTDARPGNFQLYAIKPLDGSSRSLTLAGNANMEAAVYAPDSDVEIKGGGSSGQFSGSVVGKTVFMNGVTTVHYDESLARNGLIVDYRIVSWVEDTR